MKEFWIDVVAWGITSTILGGIAAFLGWLGTLLGPWLGLVVTVSVFLIGTGTSGGKAYRALRQRDAGEESDEWENKARAKAWRQLHGQKWEDQ